MEEAPGMGGGGARQIQEQVTKTDKMAASIHMWEGTVLFSIDLCEYKCFTVTKMWLDVMMYLFTF